MSLTADDLNQIRQILREEVGPILQEEVRPIVREEAHSIISRELEPIKQQLDRLEGKVEALENDIREIYTMISDLQKRNLNDKGFRKLSLRDRLLVLNDELLVAAKEAGIALPR